MRALIALSLLISLIACIGEVKTAAKLRPHPDETWGEEGDGLSCRIQLPAEVKQGQILGVALHLKLAPAATRFLLVEWPANECSKLEFLDSKGVVLTRLPAVSGMPSSPGFCGEDIYRDLRAPNPPDSFFVPLVSGKGEMLEPGTYQVTAVYENRVSGGWSPSGKDSVDQQNVWTGRVRSAPLILRIAADKPRKEQLEYFTGIEVFREVDQWWWRWDQRTRKTKTVSIRPGHYPGRRITAYRGRDRVWAGSSLSGGLNPGDFEKQIGASWYSSSDSVLIELTVFETSEGTPHMWMPEAGDYRVLHKQEIWAVPGK